MRYKVLYVEDKPKEFFLDYAYEKKVDVEIIEYYDDLIAKLDVRDHTYDAVILDAFGRCNENDPKLGFKGLSKAVKFLDSLRGEKEIPYFIYTGEDEKFGGDFNEFSDVYDEYYEKGTDDDKLINDIIGAIKDQPNKLIRKDHNEVFKLFKDGFLGEEYEKHLLKILKSINREETDLDDELYFNQIRHMLEAAMRKANDVGILHDRCLSHNKNKVILSHAKRFLSRKRVDDLKIQCQKEHLPKLIYDHIESIINITNIGSHAEKDGKEQSEANLKEYRNRLNTPYLLYSLTFKLMDVLLWFSSYINENDNYDLNKSLWVDLNEDEADNEGKWIVGTITKKQVNGWGTFTPDNSSETIGIPPYMMDDNSIEEYQKIGVITKPNPNGASPHVDRIKTSL